MIQPADLVVGKIYYTVQYAEPEQRHPIIMSYKYKGKTDNGKLHYFEAAGGLLEGNLFMDDSDLRSLVDREGLKEEVFGNDSAS